MTTIDTRPNRNIARCTETGRWRVKIIREGVTHEVGRFDTLEEARAARDSFPPARRKPLPERSQLSQRREVIQAWREFLASAEYLGLLAQIEELVANKQRQLIESGLPAAIVYSATT